MKFKFIEIFLVLIVEMSFLLVTDSKDVVVNNEKEIYIDCIILSEFLSNYYGNQEKKEELASECCTNTKFFKNIKCNNERKIVYINFERYIN